MAENTSQAESPIKKSLHPAIVPIAIVIAGGLIGASIYFSRTVTPGAPKASDNPALVIKSDDHIVGNPKAKIVVIEYSDLECPYCKGYNTTTTRLLDTYGASGDMALVFRHFPLDVIHKKSAKEAEATECAAELGGNEAFWKYLNGVFDVTPSNDGLDLAQLPVIAEKIGLDKTAFQSCLDSGRHADDVTNDQNEGLSLGVQGTPYSIFILEQGTYFVMNGAFPFEMVDMLVKATLGGAPATASQGLIDLVQKQGVTQANIDAYVRQYLVQYLPKTDATTQPQQ
ncbi:MAG: thioredoxin domain-containing protein [Candidatus Yonathbacteria bacterium]|nr:thioredoxin domain-containing protein [Candidatus Yonathbacteria bacterium]